jgi:hypothetical protein
LLISLTLISFLTSGCLFRRPAPPPEPPPPIVVHQKFVRCPVPPGPVYWRLDPDLHVCSKSNIDVLLTNLLKMQSHNRALLNALRCYEDQADAAEARED